MRIALLAATGQVGGAERVLLDALASLRRAEPGWALHLVAPAAGPLAREAAALGAEVRVVPFPRGLARAGDAGLAGGSRAALLATVLSAAPGAVAYRRRLARALRDLAPHVVHTHGFKVHVLAAAALPRGARLVWHVHDYAGSRRVMAAAMRALARRCSAAVAVSASVADDLRAVCGAGARIETVPNAVDLARFSPDGPGMALHERAGLPPEPRGTVAVGLVATMGVWKGHEVFLRALSLLPPEPPVRGYVVGGAIYGTAGSEVRVDRLREMAAELGIADRVGFTGHVDDPAAAMRALDVVVHASTRPEPFGLVIAEAMACGRPAVVSAAGGAAEVAADGVEALHAPPGDAAAMAAAIGRLAGDAGLRARMGAAGRARAAREYDRARLAAQLVPLYRSLVPAG